MIPPSERGVRSLEALGGEAPRSSSCARISRGRTGPSAVELALDLAVLRGLLDRIELEDGRVGVRLAGARQEAGK